MCGAAEFLYVTVVLVKLKSAVHIQWWHWCAIQSEEIADTLRSFAQLDSRKPLVAILDPTEQKVYVLPESVTDVTRSTIEELIDVFKQAILDFNPLIASPDDVESESVWSLLYLLGWPITL